MPHPHNTPPTPIYSLIYSLLPKELDKFTVSFYSKGSSEFTKELNSNALSEILMNIIVTPTRSIFRCRIIWSQKIPQRSSSPSI